MNDTYAGKIIIQDTDTESLVIGTVLSSRNRYDEVSDILTEDCFYNDLHRQIFVAVKQIIISGESPDIIKVRNLLNRDGKAVSPYEITRVSSGYISDDTDFIKAAQRLKELAIRRSFFKIANFLNENAFYEAEEVDTVITKSSVMIADLLTGVENSVHLLSDGLKQVYEQISRNLSNETTSGMKTGFSYFDNKSGGLQGGDLVILAGETSNGKTSMALSILKNISEQGYASFIFSLEMSMLQISARFMSMDSGVSSKDILFSRLNNENWSKVNSGVGKIENYKIYIDESSTSSIENIIFSIKKSVLKYGVKIIVVDYLQLISAKSVSGNKEQQTAYIVRKLKNAAKELGICIILLSQLSRDKDNPAPSLRRLRDSGQIEEAADVVMFVYRPEIYGKNFPEPFEYFDTTGTALIDIAKGRNIGIFKFLCLFNAETTHFKNVHIDELPRKEFQPQREKASIAKKDLPF
ncbi:replicative DNA helicase [Bacteroidia bacterium]|nr:replicative DNA helicase [Bacteroidia bacterium]